MTLDKIPIYGSQVGDMHPGLARDFIIGSRSSPPTAEAHDPSTGLRGSPPTAEAHDSSTGSQNLPPTVKLLLKRRNLVGSDIKVPLRRIKEYISANSKNSVDDRGVIEQVINILFCKIFDERTTKPDGVVNFRADQGERPDVVRERLGAIFERMQRSIKFKDIGFSPLTLDPMIIYEIVKTLQNYCMTDADRDSIGDAFEVFVSTTLRSNIGQYFTPRNVVRMMIDMIKPNKGDRIIDPACGSGGFLVNSLRYVWSSVDKNLVISDGSGSEDLQVIAQFRMGADPRI